MKIRFVSCFSVLFLARGASAQDGVEIPSPVPFRGLARLETLRKTAPKMEARATYPRFLRRTPLLNFANVGLRDDARRGFDEFVAQWNKDRRDPALSTPNDYSYQSTPTLYFFGPRLVSTARDFSQYNGGAHGYGGTLTLNFGQFAGMKAPKKLALGDFFRAGSPYQKTVQTLIFTKLRANKEQEATWLLDGSVKALAREQFDNFVVSPRGLTWFFNPYEIGPYAAGQYIVTLSPRELGTDLRASEVWSARPAAQNAPAPGRPRPQNSR